MRLLRPVIVNALRNLTVANPYFDVVLREVNADDQVRGLARCELDIAVGYALPQLANLEGIEESRITEEPFALVVPERAYVDGELSLAALEPLRYLYSPREPLMKAAERWLGDRKLTPHTSTICELGTETIAYASAGFGYGFLPALWSSVSHEGAMFVPAADFEHEIGIAAYSLAHVTQRITRLREELSLAARDALSKFRTGHT
jgi:DNA-binding transcriptional LysR family regulator